MRIAAALSEKSPAGFTLSLYQKLKKMSKSPPTQARQQCQQKHKPIGKGKIPVIFVA
jgi:hypothetical protein